MALGWHTCAMVAIDNPILNSPLPRRRFVPQQRRTTLRRGSGYKESFKVINRYGDGPCACSSFLVPDAPHLLVFGPGYAGSAVARAAAMAGIAVTIASRHPAAGEVSFVAAEPAIAAATHLLATAPPGDAGDPILACHARVIAAAPRLVWIGYLSTTGVYGDRGGATVDEDTQPAPLSQRSRQRLAAEEAWELIAAGRALDIFRLGGIYGPGRSPFAALRAGTARPVAKPGHKFGRIHRDDIALAVLAALRQPNRPGVRHFNLVDNEPAEQDRVIEEAADLLGLAPPAVVPYADAQHGMSPMARSFWAESRIVSSRKTQAALGITWRYPSYREGLRAILIEEGGEGTA
jgi:nucleoside-diphosphate-sugar epimerase